MKLQCVELLSSFAFNFNPRRYEEGKLALRLSSFCVQDVVRSVNMQVKSAAQEKGLKLLSSVSPVLDGGVRLLGRAVQVHPIKTRVESAYGVSA